MTAPEALLACFFKRSWDCYYNNINAKDLLFKDVTKLSLPVLPAIVKVFQRETF